MGLDRVFRDEQLLADLAVAEPRRDQAEDLVLARSDGELLQLLRVEDERAVLPDAHFLHHHDLLLPAPQAQPATNDRKDHRHQPAIDLGRIGADEMLVLDHLQQRDEHPADRSVEEDPFQENGSLSEEAALKSSAMQFRGYLVDSVHRTVTSPGGRVVRLEPKAFDLLAYFAAHPEEMLSREL